MSLRTREEMESNMLYLAKGIRGLEYKKFFQKDKESRMARVALGRRKTLCKYLDGVEAYSLPEEFHEDEKIINVWLGCLKAHMKNRKNLDSLLFVSKIYDRLDTIHEKIYGSKLPSKANESCMC